MIIVRRAIASFLAVLFIPLFLVALAIFQLNNTVLSADFYVDQLRKADVFNFAYDEVLPAVVEQTDADARLKAEALPAIKRVLPPAWLEEQTEGIVVGLVPYVVGDTDTLTIPVLLNGPIQALGEEVKLQVADEDNYDLAFDLISQALERPLEDARDLPMGLTIRHEDLVESLQVVASHRWVKETAALVVDEVTPYLTGDAEHFTVTVPVADRIEVATPEVKTLLAKAGAYQILESRQFHDTVEQQLSDFGELPFGITVTTDEIVTAAQEIAPSRWLQSETEEGIDALAAYLTGDEASLVITIELKDRVTTAAPVAKRLLKDSGAYQRIFDEVVGRLIAENLGSSADLPDGKGIEFDARETVLQSFTADFVESQGEAMVDELALYLTGQQEGLRLVVPLEQPKAAMRDDLEEAATEALRQRFDGLRPCTFDEAVTTLRVDDTGFPDCRPDGFTLNEMKHALDIGEDVTAGEIAARLGVDATALAEGVTFNWLMDRIGDDVVEEHATALVDALPGEFVFTEQDLRGVLGPEDEEKLDTLLDWTRNGFRYTGKDLREDLAGDGGDDSRAEILDTLLDWGRNGIAYSDADLKEAIAGDRNDPATVESFERVLGWIRRGEFTQADLETVMTQEHDNTQAFDEFQRVRERVATARVLGLLLLIPPPLLLLGTAFLGGRGWSGRLKWGGLVLLTGGLLAFVLAGPVFDALVWERIDREIEAAGAGVSGAEGLAIQKAREVAESVADAVVGGLARWALALALLGGGILAASAFWRRVVYIVRKRFVDTPHSTT